MFPHESHLVRTLMVLVLGYSLGGLLVIALILAFLTGLLQALAVW